MEAPLAISLAFNAALVIGGMIQTLRVGLWRQEAEDWEEMAMKWRELADKANGVLLNAKHAQAANAMRKAAKANGARV